MTKRDVIAELRALLAEAAPTHNARLIAAVVTAPAAIDASRCSAHVYLAPTNKPPCGKRARVERGGRWYCGQHDPERKHRQVNKTDQAPSRAVRLSGEWLDGELRSRGEGGSFRSSGEAGHALHAYLAAHGLQVVEAERRRSEDPARRALLEVAEAARLVARDLAEHAEDGLCAGPRGARSRGACDRCCAAETLSDALRKLRGVP